MSTCLFSDESDTESVESWDENSLGIEECLFCSFISQSLEDNVGHMTSKHSFFLPDAEYLSDLEGLITYLGKNFLCPQRNFGRHIVIALSVRPSVRQSVSPSVRQSVRPAFVSGPYLLYSLR